MLLLNVCSLKDDILLNDEMTVELLQKTVVSLGIIIWQLTCWRCSSISFHAVQRFDTLEVLMTDLMLSWIPGSHASHFSALNVKWSTHGMSTAQCLSLKQQLVWHRCHHVVSLCISENLWLLLALLFHTLLLNCSTLTDCCYAQSMSIKQVHIQ